MTLLVIGRDEVRRCLTQARCIPLMRDAMIALSRNQTKQLPRGIIDLERGRAFGVMVGAMPPGEAFGAKVISVFPENAALGRQSHQGAMLLFDPDNGALVALIHAGELTAIRTAAASAIATSALARRDARHLAILGYGEQAYAHAEAIAEVRDLAQVTIWGRQAGRRSDFARELTERLGLPVRACQTAEEAVEAADIVCAVTAASEPVLCGRWISPGCHVNLVGSSRSASAEADNELVARSRFFADHKPSVLAQGGEFLRAREAGLVGDDHILGEIGEVLDGTLEGRLTPGDVTVYKSLGSIVQDLAAAEFLYQTAVAERLGREIEF